jgi:pilus assembly protein CpaC
VSEIPLLGGLFGVKREQERHTELAIFVTPMIVDPRDPSLTARVANAQGLLNDSFPTPPRLNTPVNTLDATASTTPPNTHETFGQWESDAEATAASTNPVSQWEERFDSLRRP